MAQDFKVLAQSNPSAASLTDAYTVPGGGVLSAVISSIKVANRSASATAFRVSVAIAGAADSNEQYIAYDVPIAGNDVVDVLTDGKITVATTDVVRVYATLATLSFGIFGAEVS